MRFYRNVTEMVGRTPLLELERLADGRAIYGRVLSEYPSPLDIRLVGMCTAKDMFGHVPMDFSPL